MVGHLGLSYKLKSTGIGGQFLSIVSELLNDRRQHVRLNCKVNASVNVVSGVNLGSVLGPLLFILYASKLFYIVENHIVDYGDDTTIHAVILRPISRIQVVE